MNLTGCSKEFKKGVTWLEKNIILDENKLQEEIDKKNSQLNSSEKSNDNVLKKSIKNLELKKKLKIDMHSIESYYILYKLKSTIFNLYYKASELEEFWEEIIHFTYEETERLWYLVSMGLEKNEHFKKWIPQILREQTIEGSLHPSYNEHGSLMRLLVKLMPESRQLDLAVKWWLTNWKEYLDPKYITTSHPFAILALTELNSEKYRYDINAQINDLKKAQNEDGSWEYIDSLGLKIRSARDSIWAISKFNGLADESAIKGLKWILSKQSENGSWSNDIDTTSTALIALLSMGHGIKIPKIVLDREIEKMNQKIKYQKPIFLHTSPLFKDGLHVSEIYKRIETMLKNAKKEIRISSLYFDMFYEYIINLKNENPKLNLRIITRPKKDIKGKRERIAKNVIDLLDIASKGNVVQSELNHARLVIIDDTELLVSSADFTRDQLYDEYNAGIWTSNKEAIMKAIDFFDNLYELEHRE